MPLLLRCLSVAYQDGVVVAQNSHTAYVELPTHPSCDSGRANLLAYPGVSTLVNLTQTGQPKKELMLGIVNEAEAQKVVKVLERLALVRNYQGSIGVVTPLKARKIGYARLSGKIESWTQL